MNFNKLVSKLNEKFALSSVVSALIEALGAKENINNKVSSISSSSTDTQYPSAKVVYDKLSSKQNNLVSGTNIKTINNNNILGSGNIKISSATGELPQFTYTDLQNIIDNAPSGATIYLNGYFKYNSSDSITQITINKSLTIIGKGCIIDGNGNRAFNITGNNVTIKNLNFVNCRVSLGGAIYIGGSGGSISNCSFENCSATNDGGAIGISGGSISNCSFENCSASRNGGAIYCANTNSVVDCIFKTETDTVYGATPAYTSLDQLKDGEKPTAKAVYNLVDTIYPVGSIYMSVSSTNPSILFGGVWEQIEDKFLLSSGSSYNSGDTGGEETHTLTIDEMPSHNHSRRTSPQSFAERDTSGNDIISASSGTAKGLVKNTNNTGGGLAHNNMPPYLVVNIWKRTA